MSSTTTSAPVVTARGTPHATLPGEQHLAPGMQKAWAGMILYTLLVVLFGAVVRITGSGAGCGQHWPTCQGQVVPLPRSWEMLIEFSHRLTSGLSMLLLFALTALSFRKYAAPHPVRAGAVAACVFMILEALIGARLVLLGLVGQNDSVPRAVIMAIHLINTSALLFFMVVAYRGTLRPESLGLRLSRTQWPWIFGVAALVVVSAAGAVTALGDTLYPVDASSSGPAVVVEALDSGSHFLRRLRGYHPILAFLGAGYLGVVAIRAGISAPLRNSIIWVLTAQMIAGLFNVFLSAPGWLQVVHLGLAQSLWILWIWGWFNVAKGGERKSTS